MAHSRSNFLVAAVAAALAVGLVVAPQAAAASPAQSAPAPSATTDPMDESTAAQTARTTGVRVELPGRTTETSKTFVNPGGSFTLEQSIFPVRVRRAAGWVAVDTTLARRADGTITPAAAVGDVEFSGGGSVPMARVRRNGVSFTLGWPGQLPAPTLAGDTATYSEVLPGVDLLLRALPEGFSDVLVVKTKEAGGQPGLRQVRFTSGVSGGSLKAVSGGGFTVADGLGTAVFTSPRASMWDSTHVSTDAPADGRVAPGRDASRGPGEGSRIAPVGQQSDQSAVTLTPDVGLLTGSGTKFPVYIDPTVHFSRRQASTMIDSANPNTSFHNTFDPSILGVGYNNTTGTAYKKRLFWRFDTAPVRGKTITAATFKAYEVYAYSCTAAPVYAWETSGFDTGTTWNTRPPSQIAQNDKRTVAYGRSGCYPAGQWVEFNTKAAVSRAAASGWVSTTLGLYAYEGNNDGWKRFRQDAELSITYNLAPLTPNTASLRTSSPTTACVTGAARPSIPNDAPILWARLEDESGDSVQGIFELKRLADNALFTVVASARAPNVDYAVQTPAFTAPIGGVYSWRVQAKDAAGAVSPWSASCEFTVDPAAPPRPTVTAAPDADPGTVEFEAPLGTAVSFTMGTGGDPDVSHFRWSVNNDGPTSANVPVASPTVTMPMNHLGTNVFRVWSYDAAGNISPREELLVLVSSGAQPAPINWWKLDEGAGTAAANAIGAGSGLTLAGGAAWTGGPFQEFDITDLAVRCNGTTAAAASAASNLLPTDQNFTVTAWVRLPTSTTGQVAVSADGVSTSAFTLGLVPASDGLPTSYAVTLANPTGGASAVARWAESPLFGEWVHLAAVYEAGTHVMTFYVGGLAVRSVSTSFSPALTTGLLRLGRVQSAGSMWSGDVDDVRIFTGALNATQVQATKQTRG